MSGRVFFILGGPGVGKGTQCEILSNAVDSNFIHLSAGDLLRAERNRPDSIYSSVINHHIRQGTIVPSQITIDLLKTALQSDNSKSHDFLIDGFPRNVDQGVAFEAQIKPCTGLFFFDCPEEVLINRLLMRAQTSGRDDDNIEAIRKRLVTYRHETLPVFDHYAVQKKLYKIDCNQDVKSVTENIKSILKSINSKNTNNKI